MSIATTHTPEQHGARAHTDGGWGATDAVPVQTRSERFTSTNPEDFPAVTGIEIDWKLTPVSKVRELIDGSLDGSQYTISYEAIEGVTVDWLTPSDPRVGSAGIPEDKAAANAWASVEKVLAVTVTGEEPVRLGIDRDQLGTSPRAAHTVITAKSNSHGLVVLASAGDTKLVENVEIVVE